MKNTSYTKKGPGRTTKPGKVKKVINEDKKQVQRVWIEKDKNICDDCFIQRFPDFSYEGSTALTIWRMAWDLSRETKENEKPLIQTIS